MTDQKSSPAYECDHSRNGTVHGSNGSLYLPVQGQAIKQILAAAPSRNHSVRVLSLPTVYRHTHTYPRFHPLAWWTRIGNANLSPLFQSLIATHYLLDVSTFAYCPHTWDARDAWPSRTVFTLIRDAVQFERLMQICPPWFTARTYPVHFASNSSPLLALLSFPNGSGGPQRWG